MDERKPCRWQRHIGGEEDDTYLCLYQPPKLPPHWRVDTPWLEPDEDCPKCQCWEPKEDGDAR